MKHPVLLAIGLAMATFAGLVGMLVADGPSDEAMLLLAAAPALLGLAAYWRALRA